MRSLIEYARAENEAENEEIIITKQMQNDIIRLKVLINYPQKGMVNLNGYPKNSSINRYYHFVCNRCLADCSCFADFLHYSIIKKVDKNQTPEQRIQELEAENEKLQAELDQQLVQRVMDKVENRGEGR